jgi:hypothetical protein
MIEEAHRVGEAADRRDRVGLEALAVMPGSIQRAGSSAIT